VTRPRANYWVVLR
jgi:hypothetical protein